MAEGVADEELSPGSAPPVIDRYNVRTMRCSERVTVMKRFQAFVDRSRPFAAKQTWKRAVQTVQAVRRFNFGSKTGSPRNLAADLVVVTGHEHGTLQVRNFDTGEVLGSGRHYNESTVTVVQVTNSYVFTAVSKKTAQQGRPSITGSGTSDDCDIFVWDMTNLNCIAHTLEGHEDRVCSLAVPEWNELTPVSGSLDKTIMIWDISKGKRPTHILKGHGMMVKYLLLTRSLIISASSDQSLRLWDWEGEAVAKYETAHTGPVFYLSFGLTEDTVMSACGGGVVRESAIEGRQLKTVWFSKLAKGQIIDIAFDAKYVAVCSAESPTINFYIKGQRESRKIPVQDASVRTLEMDGRRQCLLCGSDDGLVVVWNYRGFDEGKAPTVLLQVQAHRTSISSLILDQAPSGAWERIITCAGDQTMFILDFVTDRDSRTHDLKHPPQELTCIPYSGSLVTTHGHQAFVWNPRRREHKANYGDGQWGVLKGHVERVVGIRYCAEEQKLLTLSHDGSLKIWDVSFYDEAEMRYEELITSAATMDMRHPCVHLSDCFGQVAGVSMSKQHSYGGIINVVNFVAQDTISHFFTREPAAKVSFIGVPNVEITQVICQYSDHDIVLHELDGKVIRSISPAQADVKIVGPLVPYRTWENTKYDPPQKIVLISRGELVKEATVILDGAKVVHDVRADWGTRLGSSVVCAELVMQSGIHCMAGLENGTFRAIDRYGTIRHTISHDGSTRNDHDEKEMPAHVQPRRRLSYSNAAPSSGLSPPQSPPASSLHVAQRQRYAVLGFADGVCILWDTTAHRAARRFHAFVKTPLTSAAVIGTRLITCCSDAIRFDNIEAREDHTAGPESPPASPPSKR
eukprot:TRINITY_DN4462_c0_g2_i1.p1 TRINITY_DN4462_c0_g2~~TRINITY_DN4462_c0_g2_i1.p1  ORF type:complete len:885 (+),score=234.60 TRINITY_DN4462_c0_g2_i1:93-2657(+)